MGGKTLARDSVRFPAHTTDLRIPSLQTIVKLAKLGSTSTSSFDGRRVSQFKAGSRGAAGH